MRSTGDLPKVMSKKIADKLKSATKVSFESPSRLACRKLRATAPLPCAGEELIECAAKCPVRALFSLSQIDEGSSVLMIIIWCTCTCTVHVTQAESN